MKPTAGMTLLEVLIAIVVLAVGVLAAAAMQTNALSATSDARAIQGVTELAEQEIELRRQLDYSATSTNRGPNCISAVTGYTCTVAVNNCQMPSTTLICLTSGATATNDVAYQVTVTVGGPREKTITLKTVRSR